MTAVVVVLGLFTISCLSLTLFRVYRFKVRMGWEREETKLSLYDPILPQAIFECSLQSDSMSTKDMIVSPSGTGQEGLCWLI